MAVVSDCHVHSAFSHDGRESFDALAAAAAQKGLGWLCVSDHADDCVFADFDPDSMGQLSAQVGHVMEPYSSKTELYDAFLAARQRAEGKVGLLLGVEIGGVNHDPKKAAEIASLWPFDYILGSIHNLKGRDDFYILDYGDGSGFDALARDYLDECIQSVELGGFDALAHLGYFLRYMARAGLDVSRGFMPYEELLRVLFDLMRHRGIALELNTSGTFYGFGDFIPSKEVFRLYRSVGGELVTLGSDSHSAAGVGSGIADGMQMLASLGFKYYTVYRNRKPMMLPLI